MKLDPELEVLFRKTVAEAVQAAVEPLLTRLDELRAARAEAPREPEDVYTEPDQLKRPFQTPKEAVDFMKCSEKTIIRLIKKLGDDFGFKDEKGRYQVYLDARFVKQEPKRRRPPNTRSKVE